MQNHINRLIAQPWPRLSGVTLDDGNLRCVLEPTRCYDLQDSYGRSPHAQFLSARTNAEMCAFVRAWGCLYLRDDQRKAGIAIFPIGELHATRRYLTAFIALIKVLEHPTAEHETLQEFVEAAEELDRYSNLYDPGNETQELFLLRSQFGVKGAVSEWVTRAATSEVRAAIQLIVEAFTPAPTPVLKVVRQGNKSVVKTQWPLTSLETALRWMIWYDVDRKDPLYCCQECRKFFKSESKHERKFCSLPAPCGQRAAARKWRKADLKKKRLAKEAEKKGKANGTHKAR